MATPCGRGGIACFISVLRFSKSFLPVRKRVVRVVTLILVTRDLVPLDGRRIDAVAVVNEKSMRLIAGNERHELEGIDRNRG
jgi:hypothetical protein